MAKHKFVIGLFDKQKNRIGARCGVCGQITLYVNGVVPSENKADECPQVKEDFSQAAARIVREATSKLD